MKNQDDIVVSDFGEEWGKFKQDKLTNSDHVDQFNSYFHIFPWHLISEHMVGADIGCGSGRWASLVAPKVGHLHLVDPSKQALEVAKTNLKGVENTSFDVKSVHELPFENNSLDFAYCLGVLHHIPDTLAGIKSISDVLKPGAPFLIYLYYAFDNRPLWFKLIWKTSDLIRALISSLPTKLKHLICEAIALLVYFPLTRIGRLLRSLKILPRSWPLSYYLDHSYYVLRTDALDRFGTKLERRFTKDQIKEMLENSGFENIKFSDTLPHWCAIGSKRIN
jgi:ubiquinone/menaquinone biosynthesis C-methylase UbiE